MQAAILTTAGLAELNSAYPETQVNISHMAVGDGNGGYPVLTEGMIALTNEVFRTQAQAPLRDPIDPTVMIFEMSIPPLEGGFTVREAAIFSSTGTMIAIGHTIEQVKPIPSDFGATTMLQRLHVRFQNTTQVSVINTQVELVNASSVTVQGSGIANETTVQNALNKRVRFVQSISELISVNTAQLNDGDTFSVTGYHSGSNEGGGEFVWDSSRNKNTHNGGTIIDPTRTFPSDWANVAEQETWFSASGVGNGCWVRNSAEGHVRHFGAVGNGVSDDTLPIQITVDNFGSVNLGAGHYRTKRAIVLAKERQVIRGVGSPGPGQSTNSALTLVRALPDFEETTIGGSTGKAVFWYQRPDGLWTNNNWIEGGEISNMTIDCRQSTVEGIRYNRVTSGQVFRNLRIVGPTIGIHGTKWGWATEFDNIYINRAVTSCIKLTNAYNGCTFSNCWLYGGDVQTDIILDMSLDCYGNSFHGGAIEGGRIGVQLKNAQLAIHGTDFEVISEKFIEITGLRNPETNVLNFANPPCTMVGCTFVGVPSISGIEVNGGSASVVGCMFYNTTSFPSDRENVYLLRGIDGGDQTVANTPRLCISEMGNTSRGWPVSQYATGQVFSRTQASVQGRISTKKLKSGDSQSLMPETSTYDTYLVGKARIPRVFQVTNAGAIGTDFLGARLSFLGDVATVSSNGEDGYVENYFENFSSALNLFRNHQGGSPSTGYGKVQLSTKVTQNNIVLRERSVWVDSLDNSLRPGIDNSGHSLGTAAFRWTEVFAGTGAINTSDENEKQDIEEISFAESQVAKKAKTLIKKYRFKSAVKEKGERARIHFGIIAQELEEVFKEYDLDPYAYGVLCYDEWYEYNGDVVYPNSDGEFLKTEYYLDGEIYNPVDGEEIPEGVQLVVTEIQPEKKSRMGVRYDELFAFILSSI
jgi:hypothetical protein